MLSVVRVTNVNHICVVYATIFYRFNIFKKLLFYLDFVSLYYLLIKPKN